MGRVEGRVLLLPGEAPAVGARVLLLDTALNAVGAPAAECDARGRFRVDGLPPGWYLPLVASGTRIVYDPPGHPLRVVGGRATPVELGIAEYPGLAGAGLPVKGRVIDAILGTPIAGAWVSIGFTDPAFLAAGSLPPWETVTDDDGRFTLREVPILDGPGARDGLFPVVAARAGYRPGGTGSFLRRELLPFANPDGDTLEVTVALLPGSDERVLGGRVLHGDRGVGGLLVALSFSDTASHLDGAAEAWPDESGPARRLATGHALQPRALVPGQATITDGEGKFRFTGLSPGRYRVHPAYLSDDGWVSADIGRPPGPAIPVFDRDVDTVTVAVVPAIPLVSPVDGEDLPVGDYRLTWRHLPGIDRYRVFFSRGNSFLLTEGFETSDSTGYILPAYYQAGDRGRWAVQAYVGSRLVASSDGIGTFRVALR